MQWERVDCLWVPKLDLPSELDHKTREARTSQSPEVNSLAPEKHGEVNHCPATATTGSERSAAGGWQVAPAAEGPSANSTSVPLGSRLTIASLGSGAERECGMPLGTRPLPLRAAPGHVLWCRCRLSMWSAQSQQWREPGIAHQRQARAQSHQAYRTWLRQMRLCKHAKDAG